jgi:iron complex outermembrane receptor protein
MIPQRTLLAALIAALPFAAATSHAAETAIPQVVVKAAKENSSATANVNAAQIQSLRSATSDTASLLRDVPGVSLYGAGGVSSLPVIHGLADDRIRTQVDGMDLISACGNHMNPPLSYIDPTHVGSVQVFAGLTPVSVGGDSIGGTIVVNSTAPEFARTGQGMLVKGEAGAFYRSNGHAKGGNLSATAASEIVSVTYSGSTTESQNYHAGSTFKSAGPAFVADGKSMYTSDHQLAGDEVGSSMYKSTNQSLNFALRHEQHLIELKLGRQDIPYQGFPNQRMDMTGNDSTQANLRYRGQFDGATVDVRIYDEHTRHKMNFLDDKAYWYRGNAPGMPMDTEGKNTGVVIKADIGLSDRDLLRLGGEYQRYRFSDWWLPSGTGGMAPNTFWSVNAGERDRKAAFAEWETRWNPQWLSQLGIRHESVTMNAGAVQGYNAGYTGDANAFNNQDRRRSDHNLDISALARYTPDATQSIEFGLARKTRSPNIYERFAWSTGGMAMNMINMVGDGNGYVGNLDLKPEVAHTLSATAHWHDAAQQNWGLKVTPYVTVVTDYINARRCGLGDTLMAGSVCAVANLAGNDKFVFLKYANQDAKLVGIDVSGHVEIAKTSGYGNFSATGVLNYVRGKTTAGTADDLYNIMPVNARLAMIQSLAQWTNTIEIQLVAAKTHVSQIRNELETGGYGLLNVRSRIEWNQFSFNVGIENLLDKHYDYPLAGAYVGQGTTMPPMGGAAYGIAIPGMGRSIYAGMSMKF